MHGSISLASSISIAIVVAATACSSSRAERTGGDHDANGAGAGGASGSDVGASGGPDGQSPNGGSKPVVDGSSGAGDGAGAGGKKNGSDDGQAGATIDPGSAGAGIGGEDGVHPARGRVVDFETGRSLPGRRVVLGASLTRSTPVTETDQDGFFEFEESEAYQVLIIDPDGSTISFYEGLTGSEPLLVHHPSPDERGAQQAIASVSGLLSGGASYPLRGANDMVVVHFLSSEVTTRDYIGAAATSQGPEYALWPGFGSSQLTGTILALGIFRDPADQDAYSAAATIEELTVVGGKSYSRDLTLTPLPLGRISGQVNVPTGWKFSQTSEYYRFPIPDARIGFPYAPQTRINPVTNGGAFEYEIPDLRELGGALCVVGIAEEASPDKDGWLSSEQCDLALGGASIDIDFEEATSLTEPAPGTGFSAGTRFSWARSGSRSAPNLVELEPGLASAITPAISIFTTSATATLPNLELWGVKLSASAEYSARPIGLASDGDAFGESGFGAVTPKTRRMSAASQFPLVVKP